MIIQPGALQMDSVSVRIGRKYLVQDVSLELRPGEMLGLLGPNGAGKSSLLRTIYRINRPSKGVVRIDGEDVWQHSSTWVARQVGAVLQDIPADFPLTVRDIIAMGRSAHKALLEPDTAHDLGLIDAAISLLHLENFQDRPFRTLSGGERQRVLLARALVQQPRILVLDEPTNHLDIHYQLSLLRFVREIGTTVIAALHDLNLASMFCDRLCLMDQGRLVAIGSTEEVLTPERIGAVYRIDAVTQRHPRTGTVWVLPA